MKKAQQDVGLFLWHIKILDTEVGYLSAKSVKNKSNLPNCINICFFKLNIEKNDHIDRHTQ